MLIKLKTHQMNVNGVTYTTQQLVLTGLGQTALRSGVTTKTNAPFRTHAMSAGIFVHLFSLRNHGRFLGFRYDVC